jgi:hypothetical protein
MIEKQLKIDASGAKGTPEKNITTAISTNISLPDDVLEKLYRSYSLKQKRSGLGCFLAASILFDLWAIPQGQSWESLGESITLIYVLPVKFIAFSLFFLLFTVPLTVDSKSSRYIDFYLSQ